ncbi:sialic acid-binding Ig-like lectin 5 [Scomber scombrus]|uniref:Sialic acid-binding Ig-like lectin 5 n=1 Tax=Scomber scombrus TaxID=13677 RepID=A0AAV1NZM6_SCOSC
MFVLIWAAFLLSVSCSIADEAGVKGNKTTVTRTLNVTCEDDVSLDLSQKPTVIVPPLTEGQQTTLTCTAPGLCSGSVPTITWTWRGRGEKTTEITGNLTERKTENITAVIQRHSSTLTFNPLAEHHGTQVTCKVGFTGNKTTEKTVTLNVTYIKITGNTSVKEGKALNLTCSVEGFSSSDITWTEPGSKKSQEETKTDLQNDTEPNLKNNTETNQMNDTETQGGIDMQSKNVTRTELNNRTSTLFISNMRSDRSGRYICTAKYLNTTLTTYADITVTWQPKILNNSGCEKSGQSNVVTCVCISHGVPLPTIKWPLLESHTQYSVITTVLNHTVNSTITLPVTDHRNTVVGCVSSNENGEAKENLTAMKTDNKTQHQEQQNDSPFSILLRKLLTIVQQIEVIIAFFIGILLSAIICCLATKCCRKKEKSSGNLAEMEMEMATIEAVVLIDGGQAVEENGTHNQEAAKGGAEAAGQSAPDGDVEPKEVEYSDIDFSMLKRRSPEAETQNDTETEYAEIKREETEEGQDVGGAEGDMLESNVEEEEVLIEKDKETSQSIPATEEEGGEDVAMYPNVTVTE